MTAAEPVYDAIVLAGGRARRLGGADKPAQLVGGASLLARVLTAVSGADTLLVVGPERPLDVPVQWVLEDPPGGGPVAALAAAVPRTSAPVVIVLAADLPWIADAVPVLLAAAPEDGRAVLVDPTGRENHLTAAWSRAALVAALTGRSVSDASMRSLADGVPTVRVPDERGWGQDCDTWDDLARARARFS